MQVEENTPSKKLPLQWLLLWKSEIRVMLILMWNLQQISETMQSKMFLIYLKNSIGLNTCKLPENKKIVEVAIFFQPWQ